MGAKTRYDHLVRDTYSETFLEVNKTNSEEIEILLGYAPYTYDPVQYRHNLSYAEKVLIMNKKHGYYGRSTVNGVDKLEDRINNFKNIK